MRQINRVLLSLLLLGAVPVAEAATTLPELRAPAKVIRDVNGIPHIFAGNDHDLYFMQGWVHAQDRFFQMDWLRRLASGSLAELLGPDEVEGDVLFRTFGLRRAAERSWPILSKPVHKALKAYRDGVNAYLQAHPLPPEYRLLQLSEAEPWSEIDSLVIAKLVGFGLSFDLERELNNTLAIDAYVGKYGVIPGSLLYFEDVFRSAPFDPASTVPDASEARAEALAQADERRTAARSAARPDPRAVDLSKDYLARVKDLRRIRGIGTSRERSPGSNEWLIGGGLSETGTPLLANDPHLLVDYPATFHQIHLVAPKSNVIGSSQPGAPFLLLGHNRHFAWGLTNNRLDATDVFLEEIVVIDPGPPVELGTVYRGMVEPATRFREFFGANVGGGVVAPVFETDVYYVPRRSDGPIIQSAIDPTTGKGIGLSVQYTGWSGTREVEAFYRVGRAKNLRQFKGAIQFFDFGSQNWAYADRRGNVAYFTSAELPIREDLQNPGGAIGPIVPPFFIRNGTGGNEWLPVMNPQPAQAIPFEILPFEEMPQIENPPRGYIVNANNDPIGNTLDNDALNQLRPGGGIFYIHEGGVYQSFRAGRITRMIEELLNEGDGKISIDEMKAMQADTVMLDAQVFVPYILQAFDNATAKDANKDLAATAGKPGVAEAIGRLKAWNFTTPTGLGPGVGYDGDPNGGDVADSVAASIYSLWRSRVVANTIDTALEGLPKPLDSRQSLRALRNQLDNFDRQQGFGLSGVNFFDVDGVSDAEDRRDIIILRSLSEALGRLASTDFFDSSNQGDYRWGRLHRLLLEHPLGGDFSAPPAGGALPAPEGFAAYPVDGGYQTVDAATHSVRADMPDDFMFEEGPAGRFVAVLDRRRITEEGSQAGGESGDITSPFYADLLEPWLLNETFPLRYRLKDIKGNTDSVQVFIPDRGDDDDDDDD